MRGFDVLGRLLDAVVTCSVARCDGAAVRLRAWGGWVRLCEAHRWLLDGGPRARRRGR